MSARGEESKSGQMMFNRESASQFLIDKHSQCLSQGLLGVYTFSIVKENDTVNDSLQGEESKASSSHVKRKLQLTSQYVASTHKFSLLKRQDPTCSFKLTDLEKFLN